MQGDWSRIKRLVGFLSRWVFMFFCFFLSAELWVRCDSKQLYGTVCAINNQPGRFWDQFIQIIQVACFKRNDNGQRPKWQRQTGCIVSTVGEIEQKVDLQNMRLMMKWELWPEFYFMNKNELTPLTECEETTVLKCQRRQCTVLQNDLLRLAWWSDSMSL